MLKSPAASLKCFRFQVITTKGPLPGKHSLHEPVWGSSVPFVYFLWTAIKHKTWIVRLAGAPRGLCPDFFSWRGKSDKGVPFHQIHPTTIQHSLAESSGQSPNLPAGIEGSILKAQFIFPELPKTTWHGSFAIAAECGPLSLSEHVISWLQSQPPLKPDQEPSLLATSSWQLSKTTTWKALSLSKFRKHLLPINSYPVGIRIYLCAFHCGVG